MRVLLISHTCQSLTEGQPKAAELGASGIDLHVLTPRLWKHYGRWRHAQIPSGASYQLHAQPVTWPWIGPAQYYLHWYRALYSIISSVKPDIIDLWEEPWGLVSAHTCWLRKRYFPHIKIISETEQNVDKRLPPPFEWFKKRVWNQADYVVARNDEALQIARRKGYQGPASVVPNAVDAQLFHPMNKGACREARSVAGFVVGYAGRLVEEKGLEDLLRAIALCAVDVNLLLIGDGPFRASIERIAAELKIESRVTIMGAQSLQALPECFNAMDVLALPSRTTARWKEQFGRVLIEAHACCVPVIGSDSGAIPQVVGDGGIVVPERNPSALAVAIMRLRNDPIERASMAQAGLETVHAKYTWKQVVRRMHEIYQELLPNARDTKSTPDENRPAENAMVTSS